MSFINYQDPRPVYEQIVDYYEKLIVKGILAKDSQMPSVRQTAAELSINPNTIQKAYGLLEKNGFIYSVKGKGSFVSDNAALVKNKRAEWLADMKKRFKEGKEIGVDREDLDKLIGEIFDGG